MVNNMNSDEAIAQTGSARAEVTAPNKNSSIHSSDCQPAANNRDLALTRKRTGHIDAAVRLLGHFVAAALVVLWSVFQLSITFFHRAEMKVLFLGSRFW